MMNRDRYILKRNEYDLLVDLNYELMDGKKCIIEALTGEYQYGEDGMRCVCYGYEQCKVCIQDWLNEEV